MLPESFWGRIQYLLQQYGTSFLSGAGNTMIIAIVGTFLGCLIGFIVGIIQTERFHCKENTGWNSEIHHGLLRGIFPRNSYDGTGNVHLLWKCLSVQY